MKSRSTVAACCASLAMFALVLAGCTSPSPPPVTTPPPPTTGSTLRGPDPTNASIEAARGTFAITQSTVPAGNGFGGGTIYYPTDTSQGTFGAIVVVPGFTAYQSSIAWYGPRVASQGFVVMTIDTITTGDLPASRGDQLNSALAYLTNTSVAASRTDRGRLAVMGWSMGGGGTFEAAAKNQYIKAIVPLAPWNTNTNWTSLRTPALVVACQNDAIAPNGSHSNPMYNSLGAAEKAYLEIAGGDHFCVTNSNTTIAKYAISWLKRWVDNDTRYSQFLCVGTPAGASAFRSTCPIA